jgi:hypothetical protein
MSGQSDRVRSNRFSPQMPSSDSADLLTGEIERFENEGGALTADPSESPCSSGADDGEQAFNPSA